MGSKLPSLLLLLLLLLVLVLNTKYCPACVLPANTTQHSPADFPTVLPTNCIPSTFSLSNITAFVLLGFERETRSPVQAQTQAVNLS